jgi:regulator of RNase E activity RraA
MIFADFAAPSFQLFSGGLHLAASAKTEPSETGSPMTASDASVHLGDIAVGDDDGLVVTELGLTSKMLDQVAAVADREKAIRAHIPAGERT